MNVFKPAKCVTSEMHQRKALLAGVIWKFQLSTVCDAVATFQRHNPRDKRVARAWADRRVICIIRVVKQLSRSTTNSQLLFAGSHFFFCHCVAVFLIRQNFGPRSLQFQESL